MWPFSLISSKLNRFFPATEKTNYEDDSDPRIGTGNKDGDKGFRKIGIKNTLLMFIVGSVIAYLLTLFISGMFNSKKVVTPTNVVQPSKVANEAQQNNPASRLPNDYSGYPINPNNTNAGSNKSNNTQSMQSNGMQEVYSNNNQRATSKPQVQIMDSGYMDNGYRQEYRNGAGANINLQGMQGNYENRSISEKNTWLTSAISFLSGTGSTVTVSNSGESKNVASENKSQDYQMAAPNTILAGSVIPVSLINGITSDVSGDVVAQVRQDVYDSVTGQMILIPQGAKLLGSYEGKTTNGQSRLGVVFNRIIFPNGYSLRIDNQKGTDDSGYPGLVDKVDKHTGRLIGAGIMTSVLAAAAQIAAGNTDTTNETYGQLAVQGAATNIMSAGSKLLERDMQITPTITIRAGTPFTVFINQDLVIPYGGDR